MAMIPNTARPPITEPTIAFVLLPGLGLGESDEILIELWPEEASEPGSEVAWLDQSCDDDTDDDGLGLDITKLAVGVASIRASKVRVRDIVAVDVAIVGDIPK